MDIIMGIAGAVLLIGAALLSAPSRRRRRREMARPGYLDLRRWRGGSRVR